MCTRITQRLVWRLHSAVQPATVALVTTGIHGDARVTTRQGPAHPSGLFSRPVWYYYCGRGFIHRSLNGNVSHVVFGTRQTCPWTRCRDERGCVRVCQHAPQPQATLSHHTITQTNRHCNADEQTPFGHLALPRSGIDLAQRKQTTQQRWRRVARRLDSLT